MASLQITEQQVAELSDEMVRRHARTLARRADQRRAGDEPPPPGLPPDAARLKALHAVLRADLQAKAGAAAPYLVVDLDACARQLLRALQAGAAYREPAAAALMSAAAALGAWWLSDERLCVDVGESVAPLTEPQTDDELRSWAEAGWADRYRFAARRNQNLQDTLRYALAQLIEQDRFDPVGLRAVANAVFDDAQQDRLRRFLGVERALIAQARLDSASLGDRRIESLCLAGDLAFGLGRFVRLATPGGVAAGADAEALFVHLRKALDALAE